MTVHSWFWGNVPVSEVSYTLRKPRPSSQCISCGEIGTLEFFASRAGHGGGYLCADCKVEWAKADPAFKEFYADMERIRMSKLDELRAQRDVLDRDATEAWAALEVNRKAGDKLRDTWITASGSFKAIQREVEIEEAVEARIGGKSEENDVL